MALHDLATLPSNSRLKPSPPPQIEEPLVKTSNSFEDITAQLDIGRRYTRLARTAVDGELQKPPCAQCVGSGGDCIRRAIDIPLSRRLELGKQHPNGVIPDSESWFV